MTERSAAGWRPRRVPLREAVRAASFRGGDTRLVCTDTVVASVVRTAVTPWSRLRGLLGRPRLADGEALLLHPCSQVHTFGLRYPIDTVFCDRDLTVLAVQTLGPRRLSRHVRGARCCFELPAGTASAAGVAPGANLTLEAAGSPSR